MTEEQALQKLAALCSQAEHCTHEMNEKMDRWGIEVNAQERIAEYLVNNRYVDDRRYARSFVNDKLKYNKWGRRKIEQALWLKHLDKAVMQEALDDIDEADWISVLRPLLQSKRRTTKADSDYEMNTKLFRYAMSRGFRVEEIRKCIDCDDIDVDEEEE